MKLDIGRGLNSTSRLLYNLALRRLVSSFGVYHPVAVGGQTLGAGDRGCEDRWKLIQVELERTSAQSLLDLGCAEGYFVRRAASEHGCVALGIDGDVRRLMVAQTTAVLDQNYRAGFMLAQFDFEFFDRLPVFDVVLYQSVMHHVMYEHGVEHARETLQRIKAKTAKALIFDMGQSNEVTSPWARLLPDMGPEPHEWIQKFIASAGFTSVRKVGETDAYRHHVRRAVFVATP